MAEKKKMSVAEMLAAARKADSKQDASSTPPAATPETTPASEVSPPVAETPATEAPAEQPAEAASAKPAAKPAAAGGARPSVSDILAMARAKKAEAGAETPAAKPTPKPTAAKESPAKPAAPKPGAGAKPAAAKAPLRDTASILAAARAGAAKAGPVTKAEAAAKPKVERPAAKVKPTIAKAPVKPAAFSKKPEKKPADDEDRRGFLGMVLGSALGLGFTSLAATFGLWTLGTARFMFPNVLAEPPSRFKVGPPANFAPGQVETKFVAQYGVWVVNGEYSGQPQIYALKTVCTHLGCTPNWLEGEQKFKCPCHGSGFYKDGINFEGPAPRPLERYAIALSEDGQIEIDKSKTYQEEVGQWANPESFVPV